MLTGSEFTALFSSMVILEVHVLSWNIFIINIYNQQVIYKITAIYNGYINKIIDNILNKTKKIIENKFGSTLNEIQNNEKHIGLDLHTIKIYKTIKITIKHKTHNYPKQLSKI